MTEPPRRTIWQALYDKAVEWIDHQAISDLPDVADLLRMQGPLNPKGEKAVDAVFEDLPAKAPRKRRKAAPALPAPEDVSQPLDREK